MLEGKKLKRDQIRIFQKLRGNFKRIDGQQLQEQYFDNHHQNVDSILQIDIMDQDDSSCNLMYRNQDLNEGDINLNNLTQKDESSQANQNSEQISENGIDIQQFDDELERQIQLDSIYSEIDSPEMIGGIKKIEEQLNNGWDNQFEKNIILIKKQSQNFDKLMLIEEDLLQNQRPQSQNVQLINTKIFEE
ncbi:UNKNOWN [Stylonychia lemnae]|uniref:Uncharacterized protein n=1 Tax=Stylonychia lemnae TaxID=5949 RepID=A0A078AQF6_STYLE|nr:UNKNOWN [Stylonychia lemnae]|eukprot:CDW84665.1 UNKNOWN [Stylonychia lemnae]